MNPDLLKGKWKELKGEVQRSWGRLSDDELEQTKGDLAKIAGLIQQKYGATQESVQERLAHFIKNLKNINDNKNEQPRIEK